MRNKLLIKSWRLETIRSISEDILWFGTYSFGIYVSVLLLVMLADFGFGFDIGAMVTAVIY